ncbi:S9 family peptidase, partial [Lysobacter sp. D1-1-M9]|uniref:TolB family protein n=1 Tax=Novilysobacter longmucuonensis TaxID=3098603 RepID=UPI0032028DCC
MEKPLIPVAGLILAMSISSALAQTPPTPADRIADTELISREALFGNPERALVMISPDGKTLSWIAPVDGVMNVWVAPANDPSQARAVTDDEARGIRRYFWSYLPDTLLYLRDTGGDEDFHLYSVNVATGETRDL